MARKIPQSIKEINVFINGIGYLGSAKNFKIPTIEVETTELKGAMSANVSTGAIKPLECELKISTLDLNVYAALGSNLAGVKIPLLLKASLIEDGKEHAVSVAISGDILSYEVGDMENGKEVELALKIAVRFESVSIDGVPMLIYDYNNLICIVGGVDLMSKVRSNLGE